MAEESLFGVEKIRRMCAWYAWQRESFNQSFTLEQLVRLWEYACEHDELPEFADSWTESEIKTALGDLYTTPPGQPTTESAEEG